MRWMVVATEPRIVRTNAPQRGWHTLLENGGGSVFAVTITIMASTKPLVATIVVAAMSV